MSQTQFGFYTASYESNPTSKKQDLNKFAGTFICQTFDTLNEQGRSDYEKFMLDIYKNPTDYIIVAHDKYNYDFSMYIRVEVLKKDNPKSKEDIEVEKEMKIDELIDGLVEAVEFSTKEGEDPDECEEVEASNDLAITSPPPNSGDDSSEFAEIFEADDE